MVTVDYSQIAKQNKRQQILPVVLLVLLLLGIAFGIWFLISKVKSFDWQKTIENAQQSEQTTTPQNQQSVSEFNSDIQQAKNLWSAGKYVEMMAPANSALTLAANDQDKGVAYYWIGVSYYKQDMLEQSFANENKAISLYPDFSGPYITRAAVYLSQSNIQAACVDAQKAVRLDTNYAWAHNILGLCFADSGENADAIKELQKAVQLDPNTSVFQLNLTRIQEQQSSQATLQDCSKIQDPLKQYDCIINAGINNRDISVCDTAPPKGNHGITDWKDGCLNSYAIVNKDSNVCDLLPTTSRYKNSCLEFFSSTTASSTNSSLYHN